MAVKCPSCKNDLYKPFTYCESCGWEAEGKDLDKARKLSTKEQKKKDKDLDKRRSEMTDKYLKREKKLGREIPDSERRDEDYEDLDDEEFKDIFGEFDEDDDDIDEDYGTTPKKRPPPPDDDDEGVMIPCKCGNVIKVMSSKRPIRINCPKCGRGGTLKKDPPGTKKIKDKGGGGKPDDGNECPECGTKTSAKFCPECGAKIPPPGRGKRGPPGDKKRERPLPEKKEGDVPRKGKCSQCSGTRLQFKDDGRGRCRDCGRKFWWDPSKKPPKKGGGGNRRSGGKGKGDRGGGKPRGGGGGKKPPRCPECRQPMEFVKKYKRFYCWDCNLYDD